MCDGDDQILGLTFYQIKWKREDTAKKESTTRHIESARANDREFEEKKTTTTATVCSRTWLRVCYLFWIWRIDEEEEVKQKQKQKQKKKEEK